MVFPEGPTSPNPGSGSGSGSTGLYREVCLVPGFCAVPPRRRRRRRRRTPAFLEPPPPPPPPPPALRPEERRKARRKAWLRFVCCHWWRRLRWRLQLRLRRGRGSVQEQGRRMWRRLRLRLGLRRGRGRAQERRRGLQLPQSLLLRRPGRSQKRGGVKRQLDLPWTEEGIFPSWVKRLLTASSLASMQKQDEGPYRAPVAGPSGVRRQRPKRSESAAAAASFPSTFPSTFSSTFSSTFASFSAAAAAIPSTSSAPLPPPPPLIPLRPRPRPRPTEEPKVETMQVASRNVVAWRSKAEWEQVMVYLFCQDPELQRHALNRVSAWKSRCSNNLPLAVACTTDLVLCKLLDETSALGSQELVLLYGMALVRTPVTQVLQPPSHSPLFPLPSFVQPLSPSQQDYCGGLLNGFSPQVQQKSHHGILSSPDRFVNIITEPKQKIINIPLRRLAHEMHIPEWIVNLRHNLTHRNLPRLNTCRRGCEFVLEWLRRTYWCRQLGNNLGEPWDSGVHIREIENGEEVEIVEEFDADEETPEEEPLSEEAQKEKDLQDKIRKALLSYGEQQFKVLRRSRQLPKAVKASTKSIREVERLVGRLKKLSKENQTFVMNILLEEGFLIPTMEQLEALKIHPTEAPNLVNLLMPRAFSQFWQPLIKGLHSQPFIQELLEKMFRTLPDCADTGIRPVYLISWINELVVVYTPAGPCQKRLTSSQRSVRKSWKIGPRKFSLNWSQLLDVCLDAACWASPHLLQLVLKAMEPQLPLDSQEKLMCLCTIYTQGGNPATSDRPWEGTSSQDRPPIYTLEHLQWQVKQALLMEKGKNRQPGEKDEDEEEEEEEETESDDSSDPEVMEVDPDPIQMKEVVLKETPEMLAQKQAGLEGSPWQLCLDDINWSELPLGKIPGQTDDPDELMVDNYTLISVLDQPQINEDPDLPHTSAFGSLDLRIPNMEGPLWTQNELHSLKGNIQLF
ncbi:ribosomal biogenesis protein LAS1L isoform X3 [Monodelphis domestica]|uniref:ribosomal biogenesis protein LAS1L isoform X3 n=1 Tax=Monodelphis domestica TaxID=13616 RepID=UPI0024E1D393|nr:ribosomal biogenesis protein LAS1L isoform X3 [Monodelphis domestica]